MALADKYYTIGVLGKSFGVIELMAHQAKWELRDLAKASGLPKGTLQRILLTLCELGFVSQDGKGGAYSLTLKFFKLGQRIASNNSLVEKARPACRQHGDVHRLFARRRVGQSARDFGRGVPLVRHYFAHCGSVE